MAFITIGSLKPEKSKTGTNQYWKYSEVPVDKVGWAIDLHYRPTPFDVCAILVKGREKAINGWWTGFEWSALRLRPKHQVISWKYIKELN